MAFTEDRGSGYWNKLKGVGDENTIQISKIRGLGKRKRL